MRHCMGNESQQLCRIGSCPLKDSCILSRLKHSSRHRALLYRHTNPLAQRCAKNSVNSCRTGQSAQCGCAVCPEIASCVSRIRLPRRNPLSGLRLSAAGQQPPTRRLPSAFLFRPREIRSEMTTSEFAEIDLSNIRISKNNRGDKAYGHGNGTSTYLPVNYVVENPGLRPTTHRHRHFPTGGKPQRIRSSGAGKAMPSDCPRKSRILRGPSAP